jgi:hypothetical protein
MIGVQVSAEASTAAGTIVQQLRGLPTLQVPLVSSTTDCFCLYMQPSYMRCAGTCAAHLLRLLAAVSLAGRPCTNSRHYQATAPCTQSIAGTCCSAELWLCQCMRLSGHSLLRALGPAPSAALPASPMGPTDTAACSPAHDDAHAINTMGPDPAPTAASMFVQW